MKYTTKRGLYIFVVFERPVLGALSVVEMKRDDKCLRCY